MFTNVQDLLNEGAQKIGVVGIPPIGCLPAIITLNSKNPIFGRECNESLNALSRDVNQMLQNNLKRLERPGTKIVYADIYTPIINMVQQKTKYGKSIGLNLSTARKFRNYDGTNFPSQ